MTEPNERDWKKAEDFVNNYPSNAFDNNAQSRLKIALRYVFTELRTEKEAAVQKEYEKGYWDGKRSKVCDTKAEVYEEILAIIDDVRQNETCIVPSIAIRVRVMEAADKVRGKG